MPKLAEVVVDKCRECPWFRPGVNRPGEEMPWCLASLNEMIDIDIIQIGCPLSDTPSESKKAELAQKCPKCGKHGYAQEFYSRGGYKAYTCKGCKTVWAVGINE